MKGDGAGVLGSIRDLLIGARQLAEHKDTKPFSSKGMLQGKRLTKSLMGCIINVFNSTRRIHHADPFNAAANACRGGSSSR